MPKVVVGMSGGVDSSVAALLLKKQGYEVIGCTLEMWRDAPEVCEDGLEAAETCRALGIPHAIVNYKNEFECTVVDNFVNEYLKGRTPNPCVLCNRVAKWKAICDYADSIGAEYVATGHYANVIKLPNGRVTVANAKAAAKDQTYVLCRLTQEQLGRTLMPLGDVESKDEVRAMASEIGLEAANKKDSQDVCFIDEDNYTEFLEKRVNRPLPGPGNFVSADGKVLGIHKGITHYTVGQRKGLGIAFGTPANVLGIRPETNEVVLGFGDEIMRDTMICNDMNYVAVEEIPIGESVHLNCRVRYHHKGELCTATRVDAETVKVVFDRPVRAITPGQTAVFYDGDRLYMGGTIQA